MGRTVRREVTINFVTTKTPEQINNAAKPLAAMADSYRLQIERQIMIERQEEDEKAAQPAEADGAGGPATPAVKTAGLSGL